MYNLYILFAIILLALIHNGKIVTGHPIHPFEQIHRTNQIIEWKVPPILVNVTTFPRGLTPILPSKNNTHTLPPRSIDGKIQTRPTNKTIEPQAGIEEYMRSFVTCSNCKAGMFFIFSYASRIKSDENFKTLGDICVAFNVLPPDVCNGLIIRNTPALQFILNRANFDINEFCATILLNDDCMGNGKSLNENWEVTLPVAPKPRPTNVPLPKENSPSFKVLHLTDIHHDPLYTEGTNAVCKEPLCCRDKNQTVEKESDGAGKWGDYRNCDTPKATIDNMFDHIGDVHPDIDYIIWTGDLQPHNVWSETKEENLKLLRETVMTLKKKFPNIPVFPAIGNHDTSPVNYFPQPYITDPQFSDRWLLDELDVLWRTWLPENVSTTIKYGGFYSVLVRPGFRIISLNTNYCYFANFWLILNATDPASQLQWLIYELQAAELSNEKVHIIGHISPGYIDCMRIWSKNYYNIIRRFESTITGQFFGHTHGDEFQMFWDDPDDLNRAVNVAYIAPSVTAFSNFNPGYKIYYVDGDHADTSRMVIDQECWIFNLDDANIQGTPLWYKLYSARSSYGMAGQRPNDWKEFLNKMETDDEAFDLYYRHYWRDSPKRPNCDEMCKKRFICDARSGRSHDRKVLCRN